MPQWIYYKAVFFQLKNKFKKLLCCRDSGISISLTTGHHDDSSSQWHLQRLLIMVSARMLNPGSALSIRPTKPSRTNTQKRCPFYHRGLECKSRKSRNTWSNRQIWPWSTKRSSSKTNRDLPRERTGHSKHPLPTTQDSTHGHHQSDWLYSLQLWRISIKSAKTRPGTDCSSDCGLLIAKFRLKMKKLGKTTRPFRYDLNQIPYILYSGNDKQIQGIRFDSAWRRKWQPTPVLLPGKSRGWRSLVGYSPWVTKCWTRLSDFTFAFTV